MASDRRQAAIAASEQISVADSVCQKEILAEVSERITDCVGSRHLRRRSGIGPTDQIVTNLIRRVRRPAGNIASGAGPDIGDIVASTDDAVGDTVGRRCARAPEIRRSILTVASEPKKLVKGLVLVGRVSVGLIPILVRIGVILVPVLRVVVGQILVVILIGEALTILIQRRQGIATQDAARSRSGIKVRSDTLAKLPGIARRGRVIWIVRRRVEWRGIGGVERAGTGPAGSCPYPGLQRREGVTAGRQIWLLVRNRVAEHVQLRLGGNLLVRLQGLVGELLGL